ncbi:MAG: outer membrane beta-barrel protein [Massilia sp.]|jgi:opacity protein-like surface antigen
MNTIHIALAAGLLAAGVAHAQLLDSAAAPKELATTPAPAPPFAKIQPVPRTYMGNAAETDGLRYQDKSAFGVYVSDPKLFAGVNLAPNVAIETGYANLFTRGFHFADYARPDEVNGALGTKGFNSYLAARLNVPVDDQFSAYGKVGVAVSERVAHDRTLRSTVSDTDVGPYVGMGARYKVNGKASVTAGYEQYGNSAKKWGGDTNNSALQARFRLGF